MVVLLTGAAGFIGSQLAEKLVAAGESVVGVDCFTDYYERRIKERNLKRLVKDDNFKLEKVDLASADLSRLVSDADAVFHLAAQPGVRASWGTTFQHYADNNIVATQRLLEALKNRKLKKFIFASSSSIYGDSERQPTPEDTVPYPNSPYGATKLVGENLCRIYCKNFGLPVVILRYFTVYGPRQRPDMSFHRFVNSIRAGKPVEVYGDGTQSRDFTYVDDIVNATILSREAKPARIYNVASGKTFSLREALDYMGSIMGERPDVRYLKAAPGDVRSTSGDITRIEEELGYKPRMDLEQGLKNQITWQLAE